MAQRLGECAQAQRRGVHRAQRPQRAQAAQAVEHKGVDIALLLQMHLAGGLGAPAHQRHKQRNQRCRQHQHQRCRPRHIQHDDRDAGQHQRHAPARRLVAHQPRHHSFGLLGDDTGGQARSWARAVQRRARRQRLRHLKAQLRHLLARRRKRQPRRASLERCAQHAQQQHRQRWHDHRRETLPRSQTLHRQRQRRRLRQPQQRRRRQQPTGTVRATRWLYLQFV